MNRVLLRIPNTRSSKTNYFKFSFYLKQTHFYKKIGLFMYIICATKSHRLFLEKTACKNKATQINNPLQTGRHQIRIPCTANLCTKTLTFTLLLS